MPLKVRGGADGDETMSQYRNFFERELALLRSFLRRRFELRRRRPRSAAGPRRRSIRVRIRRFWARARPVLAGCVLSLALHAILVALLFLWLPRRDPPAPAPPRWITIRLQPLVPVPPEPAAEPPAAPPAAPTPAPAPAPPAPAAPSIAEAPPAASAAAPSSVDLRALSELQAPTLARDRSPPPTIGVGAGTPDAGVAASGNGIFERRGAGKSDALGRFGGSAGTEDAVQRGLAWLARHQDADGKWDADGFHRHCTSFTACFGAGNPEFDVGVTALALLAFLGAGFSPDDGSPYAARVERGLDALLRSQSAEGRFGGAGDRLYYNHGVATFAMAEACALAPRPAYRKAVLRALEYSGRGQQSGGGWDYTDEKTGRSDLSITGWQVMALHTAAAAGIAGPAGMRERAAAFVEASVQPDGQASYASSGMGAGRKGVAMAAVGLLSRLYFGAPPDDPAIQRAAQLLIRNPPELAKTYEWDRTFQSSYYWYYATLALFHLGGRRWEAWNHFLKKELLPPQSRELHEDGSWPPDANWTGASGGRIASTALHVLIFEIYYRYPPLHAHRPATDIEGAAKGGSGGR